MNHQVGNDKRQETARRILDAAADIFSQVGFAGARVDEIANRAEVNKATIYYHIGDKKALYAAVFHDVFSDMVARVSQNIREAQTTEEKLKTFIQNFAHMMDQHPHLPSIMLREIASGGRNFPELVVRDLARIFGILRDILKEGMNKEIFSAVTPFVVHMMVVGTMAFYKASGPVRMRHSAIPETLKRLDINVSGKIADEIESLILKAVKM
jgi:AcrR family transcriptional regulator